jgi:hypothetical protein
LSGKCRGNLSSRKGYLGLVLKECINIGIKKVVKLVILCEMYKADRQIRGRFLVEIISIKKPKETGIEKTAKKPEAVLVQIIN